VKLVCSGWLGVAGGTLAILGVVAAPITSGDTAFRSARLIIAEWLHLDQQKIRSRLVVAVPLFVCSLVLLVWQINNPDGFNVLWQYFGWSNQALSVFTLWMLTVCLAENHKAYVITLVPAVLMTVVAVTFLVVSPQALGLKGATGVTAAIVVVVSLVWFALWYRNHVSNDPKGKLTK